MNKTKVKRLIVSVLSLVLLFTMSGCGKQQTDSAGTQGGSKKVITDGLGRQVEVPENVTRLASLGNAARQLVYMGLADSIVGISESYAAGNLKPMACFGYINNERWKGLPVVGSGDGDFYAEEMIKADPEVIFCTFTAEIADDMQKKTGIPVVCFTTNTLFGEDYDIAWRLIGEVCGLQDRAEALIKFIDACLEDLDRRTKDIPADRRLSVLCAAVSFKGAHGIEGVRLKDSVLEAINTPTIAKVDGISASSAEVEREQILAWNPAYIFCEASNVNLVTEDQSKDPVFYDQLDAFKNNRIYQMPNGTSNYSNVEVPLVNAYYIGSVLYPEAFADVVFREKANEILSFFLGVDDYLSVLEDAGAYYGTVKFGC